MIRKRKLPIVGNGEGIWSLVHIEDAAAATVAAIEHGGRGVYNIVDDEPLRVPRWVGRLMAGEVAVVMMTEVRGASNAKAKRELGWQLRYPSWRQGLVEGLE